MSDSSLNPLLTVLRIAVAETQLESPNCEPMREAFRLAEISEQQLRSEGPGSAHAALAVLRESADHLRKATVITVRASENEALEHARRAMTAAFLAVDDARRATQESANRS
jgi:hypothetical protein